MVINFKKVHLPIKVPNGNHCWYGKTVCKYFSDNNGSFECDLGIGTPIKTNNRYYKKPEECRKLADIINSKN